MRKSLFDETDFEKMSPLFKSWFGHLIAKVVLKILVLDKLNSHFSKICHLKNRAFSTAWLKEVGVKYEVENAPVLEQFRSGAFVTVSNHPYGLIDGMILSDLILEKRRDYKFMVNSILDKFYPMDDCIIKVKPTTSVNGSSVENTSGLKLTLSHLRNGGVVSFFPAGAVSNYNEYRFKATDREWQATVIRLIQMAKVPIVPIFIHGRNSLFFHFLGRINWQLRSVRFPHEILNKNKKVIKLTVGEPIFLEEQLKYKSIEELADFLRKTTYRLENSTLK